MHKFLRAVGMAEIESRKELQKIITDSIQEATIRMYTTNEEGEILAEFCKDFADGIGIAVCGIFDEEDKFIYEYYYPYLRGTGISSEEDITVERHASQESYVGSCDEVKVGVSLVFALQNMISYLKHRRENNFPVKGTTLTLSALATKGTIVMPIAKSRKQTLQGKKKLQARNTLIAAARKGDEAAIESLTLDDMDTYTAISNRIYKDDVFTLVDNYFMPYGMECDQYAILGEILECKSVINSLTKEQVYIMKISCNEISFDTCINQKDLVGEPAIGRRFKGNIWMQGYINYPENTKS